MQRRFDCSRRSANDPGADSRSDPYARQIGFMILMILYTKMPAHSKIGTSSRNGSVLNRRPQMSFFCFVCSAVLMVMMAFFAGTNSRGDRFV